MGVHGLWPLLHPVARPVALETMGGKKLAIDSSIWLYQFQIAMRDKEGRALDNAHILGFLRRICKLLFYGIKPVFVFDGGAPTIKKVAISNRKNRKQGAKETAARTAEKLLAAQLRSAAIKQARKAALEKKTGDVIDENVEYLDEDYGIVPRGAPQRRAQGQGASSSSPAQASQQGDLEVLVPPKKKYVHKDQYALPVIEGPISARGAPSDPRLATEAELRSFIEDMRPEDFDMDSEFFDNLPVEAKYEIIGDLRIKSRQPNFKRVESMKNAPTALDFSRAQIMGLSHRNTLTQKLLAMTDSLSRVQPMSGPVRIAGERNKEYVLIKNDTSEGTGYVLGVRGGGERPSSPVKIETTTTEESDLDKTSTDEDFEAVQIPTHLARKKSPSPEVLQRRRELAQEAIRQRYSPVKPVRRRGDSPVDDLPALPPQRPLFAQDGSKNDKAPKTNATTIDASAGDSNSMPYVFPDMDTIRQIQSAVAKANGNDARLGKDEAEDLQRAIAASKEKQWNGIDVGANSAEDSDNDSDVSFDEVDAVQPQTITGGRPKKAAQPAQQTLTDLPTSTQGMEDSDDSVEYVKVDQPMEASHINMPPAALAPVPVSSRQATEVQPAHKPPSRRAPPTPIPLSAITDSKTTPQGGTTSLQRKKPASLHLDIPDEPVPSSISPEHQSGRTPRPDLTEKQALRDTSPQLVHEENGVVQRDYAPQPSKSPSTAPVVSPLPASNEARLVPPETTLRAARLSPRPSLMSRTLSTQSDTISGGVEAHNDEQPAPEASTLSVADENAINTGSMSILDEIRAAIPGAEEGVDKSDLQQSAEDKTIAGPAGDVAPLHTAHPPEPVTVPVHNDDRDSSPEVAYEWSPSPEPVARKRPTDPTLLPPDDPNYIPADIEFADPGHELSDLDDEDREHLESFSNEQTEYAKFLAELKSRNLDEMEQEVETEMIGLKEQDKRDKKMADDITQQMAKDIQHLLKVMGLPYVIAPMEAEAQCAELLSRALVDGVITDDNDVFLFGASKVYKNMFNQNKYVECYLGTDIERELALDRERLIRLAHFLGSDYCDGLPGVGPVLGMELMAEFPGSNGLFEFRNWWLKVQRGRDTAEDHPTAFRRKFKKSKRELYIDEGWPNPEVSRAYLHPTVDESDQPFFWGIPDLDALRDFLRANLGWGTAKTDELMLPIIRKMTGRAAGGAVNQSVISNFFDVSGGTGRYAPMSNKGYQSKRLQAVVKAWRQSQQRLAKEEGSEEDDDDNINSQSEDDRSSSRGKGRKARPTGSRKSSGSKPVASSSSRRSSKRSSSQADGTDEGDESDTAFNDEIEAKLAKMGVKRKRETPVGSNRVIKPAKKSKKAAAREAAPPKPRPRAKPAAGSKQNSKGKGKMPLFAEDSPSGGSGNDDDGPVVKSRSSKPVTPADSDEYQE